MTERTATTVPGSSGEDSGLPETVTVRPRLLAVAALPGALAASSCCIVPLALSALGMTDAWNPGGQHQQH
jgi:mercuric ion transport protein